MKCFVSGASGYIGAHLVRELNAQGHSVHALVRNPGKASLIAAPDVTIFKGEITDPGSIYKAMSGCDHVFHLAAYAKAWAPDPKLYFDLNVGGTINVLDAALKLGVKRCVVTSTAGVFGASGDGTITEGSIRKFDFFNAYESSKALAESRVKDYVIGGLDVVIVSPTRVYGPNLTGKPEGITFLIERYVNGFWRFVPGSGKRIGNYVFVKDVAKGHILAMENGKKGSTYILGGTNHNYLDFFHALREVSGIKKKLFRLPLPVQWLFAWCQLAGTLFGREPLITPKWMVKSSKDWLVIPGKAINELGYTITPLEEGLRQTVEWLRSGREKTPQRPTYPVPFLHMKDR